MAKRKITIVLGFLLFSVFLFTGASLKSKTYDVAIYCDEVLLLSNSYKVDRKTQFTIIFKHKNDIKRYLKSFATEEAALLALNPQLLAEIDKITATISKPSTPATVAYNKGIFLYEEGASGVLADRQALIEDIIYNFSAQNKAYVNKKEVPPAVSVGDLRAQTVKIAEYSTTFATSSYARKHNIAVAASKINHTILAPGQQFSYNSIVGDRTIANGFLEANIISNGKYVKGVGGGVCQASTTVYNAALIAGMTINEVSHHSLPASYVPLALDAMVSRTTDFKFTNTSAYTIYIQTKIENDKITATFFGSEPFNGKRVHLRSEIIKVLTTDEYEQIVAPELLAADEATRIIEHPKNGFLAESYLELYDGDTMISSCKIRTDYYMPQKGQIAVRGSPIVSPQKGQTPVSGANDGYAG